MQFFAKRKNFKDLIPCNMQHARTTDAISR